LRLRRKRGKTQVGFSPFYTKAILIHYPLFSLALEAQRKKLSKKEDAEREISRLARRDQNTQSVGG
jgi:hypothetical protein